MFLKQKKKQKQTNANLYNEKLNVYLYLTTVGAIDLCVNVNNQTEEASFNSNAAKYAIIGLAVTSVLLFNIYIYTHLLEKCQVRNQTV